MARSVRLSVGLLVDLLVGRSVCHNFCHKFLKGVEVLNLTDDEDDDVQELEGEGGDEVLLYEGLLVL